MKLLVIKTIIKKMTAIHIRVTFINIHSMSGSIVFQININNLNVNTLSVNTFFTQPHETGTIIIPTLKVRKLRHKED